MRKAYKILVGKSAGKRRLGRAMRSWVYNIKMYLTETGCGLESCGSEEGSVGDFSEHGKELSYFNKCGKFLD
jgi:hypothetical protein